MAKVKLTREEIKRIKKERKALRKKLRGQGIRSRAEFERIAYELGLSLDNGRKALILYPWWRRALLALQAFGLPGVAAVCAAGLGGIFAWSTMTQERGNFTINLTGDLLDVGFVLSDTEDFADPQVRLASNVVSEVNAVSLADIPDNLQDTDGSHNGKDYTAYTFYIKNSGERDSGYSYDIVLNSSSLGVPYATWVMLYDEDGQVIYSMPSADGDAENLYGYPFAPLRDQAKYPDQQYYQEGSYYGVVPTPYMSETEVMQGSVESLAVGDYKKYTVVIWIEGDDPECTNEILGGHAGFAMEFRAHESLENEDGIFGSIKKMDDEELIEQFGNPQASSERTDISGFHPQASGDREEASDSRSETAAVKEE